MGNRSNKTISQVRNNKLMAALKKREIGTNSILKWRKHVPGISRFRYHIKIYQTIFNSFFNLIKEGFFSSEKMRNSGNQNYNYAHSFFGKDFKSIPLYWLYLWLYSLVLRIGFLIQSAILVISMIMLTRSYAKICYTGLKLSEGKKFCSRGTTIRHQIGVYQHVLIFSITCSLSLSNQSWCIIIDKTITNCT